MGVLTKLRNKLRGCEHTFSITNVNPRGQREGTMIVNMVCTKCGETMETFHDLTETKEMVFRHPAVEMQLIQQGYLIVKNGKPQANLKKLTWKK